MTNSEILHTYDNNRVEFKPYGLTCELWTPNLMRKPDRHNEIELNYFYEGSMTYLFQDRKITIPSKRLALFWGLVPHQIVSYEGVSPYFVCTIPFSLFLEWKLSAAFVDRLLRGDVVFETSEKYAGYDEFLIENWLKDIGNIDSGEVTLLEIRARLSRMATSNLTRKGNDQLSVHASEISQVERIAIYIAQNYHTPLSVSEIAKEVGLHPDYTNVIFKKAFGSTLSEYIMEERISHAQRKLVATDSRITEIAFESGFNSISRFNAAFLKINACTPREFRKKYRG